MRFGSSGGAWTSGYVVRLGRFGSSSVCRASWQQSFGRRHACGHSRAAGHELPAVIGDLDPRVAAFGLSRRSTSKPDRPQPV